MTDYIKIRMNKKQYCKRCGEEEDFCDGNPSEELCKHCLLHSCENCYKELETEKEYEKTICVECDKE